MPSINAQISTRVFHSPIFLLASHLALFKAFQEEFNIMYPHMAPAVAQEIDGSLGDENLWITCGSDDPARSPDLILACNKDSHGNKLPIFITSFHPISTLGNLDFLLPRLRKVVTKLHDEVRDTRVFSVFAAAPITLAFTQLWTEKTGIECEPVPYYSATYARCTRDTFKNKQFTILGDTTYDLRLGTEKDVTAVAELCHDFASTSPPFVLSPEGAHEEAKYLIAQRKVWVHTINRPGAPEEIASIVAVTRESADVSAITKVYTNQRWRGKRCAERLVRHVTKTLLYKRNKQTVVLYVGHDNPARKVYQRVGFAGPGGEPLCNDSTNAGHWLELGFDQRRVELGHW